MARPLRFLPLGLAAVTLLSPTPICNGQASAPISQGSDLPIPPVIPRSVLFESWDAYKTRFIQADGRVIDHKGGGISTSEGQSYALLRAVWIQDRDMFNRVLQWSVANLNKGVRDDHLFAWKWGQAEDGSWRALDPSCASDADVLIAYALLIAGDRWGGEYRTLAQGVLADVKAMEVLEISGRPYLMPGDWQSADQSSLRLNPSYYMPFAFRRFAREDPAGPWAALVDTSYLVFDRCRTDVGLPTDWCHLDMKTGTLTVSHNVYDPSSDFGYEAFRVYWNLAADHRWHRDARAASQLRQMDWLFKYWIVRRELPQVVTVDGIPRNPYPFLGMYGAVLPALALLAPLEADVLYHKILSPAFNSGLWGEPEDYYVQNWIWFGLALQSSLPSPPG